MRRARPKSTFECKAQKRQETDHLGATAAISAYGVATASECGCLEKMIPLFRLLRFTVHEEGTAKTMRIVGGVIFPNMNVRRKPSRVFGREVTQQHSETLGHADVATPKMEAIKDTWRRKA